jgi:hypothetical protein
MVIDIHVLLFRVKTINMKIGNSVPLLALAFAFASPGRSSYDDWCYCQTGSVGSAPTAGCHNGGHYEPTGYEGCENQVGYLGFCQSRYSVEYLCTAPPAGNYDYAWSSWAECHCS